MKFSLVCTLILSFTVPIPGQVPGGSSARDIQTEVGKSDPRVDEVLERANDHFRKGKLNLEDKKLGQARTEFDKAIDEILLSGLDVRASQRLQTGYLELVENIYREEVALLPPVPMSQRIKNPLTLKDLYFPKMEPAKIDPELFKACKTELFDLANIRGLRLRMTYAQVKALFPSLPPQRPDVLGKSEIIVRAPISSLAMKGIAAITLGFLDAKLYRIVTRYDDASSWDSGEQFIHQIATTFRLPGDWDLIPSPHSYDRSELLRRLECRDSEIVAGIYVSDYSHKSPIVILTDTAALTNLEKRADKRLKEINDTIERIRTEDRKRFKP